ncbi:unnamed protein product [Trichobilharzia regenti]|nr:unnamed protein product [Trichobilharzia regenti]
MFSFCNYTDADVNRLDDIREHAMGALTAFTCPFSTVCLSIDPDSNTFGAITKPGKFSIRTHDVSLDYLFCTSSSSLFMVNTESTKYEEDFYITRIMNSTILSDLSSPGSPW